MRKMNQWIALALMATLGGCFFAYDYEPTANSGGAGGGGSAISGSGVGGSTGSAAGVIDGESTADPNCGQPLCDSRPAAPECLATNCLQLQWARRAGIVEADQNARAIAISGHASPIIAIAGSYSNKSFEFLPSMTPPKLPEANMMAPFTDGYVALYHGNNGVPYWVTNFGDPTLPNTTTAPAPGVHRVATSVAFDSANNLIVAGFEDTANGSRRLIVQKYSAGSANSADRLWSKAAFGMESSRTEIIAIATAQTDIYLLGRAEASMAPIGCTDPTGSAAQLKSGPFVAKLDGAGTCVWLNSMDAASVDGAAPTAITTSNIDNYGVWITGTIKNKTAFGTLLLDPGIMGPMPFAAKFDATIGQSQGAYLLDAPSNSVFPLGIVTHTNEKIYLVGEAFGTSDIAPNVPSGKSGAFVAQVSPIGNSASTIDSAYDFPITGSTNNGARTTGIAISNNLIFVSGVFAGILGVTPKQEISTVDAIGNPHAAPFLAVLKPATNVSAPELLSFDAFPAGKAPYQTNTVALAQNGKYVALGGGWLFDLDFTTHNPTKNGLLPSADTTSADAFAALFKLP